MKNFWNNDRTIFHKLPKDGNFKVEKFVLATVFIVTMFVGFGSLPVLIAASKTGVISTGSTVNLMQDLSLAVGRNNLLILLISPFILTFLAIIFSIKYIHQTKILSFFTSRSSMDWRRVLVAFATWGGIMGLMLIWTFFQSDTLVWNYNPETFIMLVLISLLFIPIQITCEELIFRSYLFKGLSFMKRPILQLVICGFLFGLMHAGNPEIEKLGQLAIVFYIWTGVFLGLLAHFDNGLELSIGYHAANNIFAAVLVTTNWQVFQTDALFIDIAEPTLGWEIGLTLFIWQPMLFFFFNWKYKWGIRLFKGK